MEPAQLPSTPSPNHCCCDHDQSSLLPLGAMMDGVCFLVLPVVSHLVYRRDNKKQPGESKKDNKPSFVE